MQDSESNEVIEKVRRALGRTAPLASAPPPPAINEPVTRLVHSDANLPELFAKRAGDLKMKTEFLAVDYLLESLIAYLRQADRKRIMISVSPLFEKLKLIDALRDAGFDAKRWTEITLDESYDYDCAVTDTTWAVAETGGLVIRTTADHGRALTLVPMYHVAVVEPKCFVPDMIDLFEKLSAEGAGNYIVMISGPSKTADIEMNVVTGVHGPNIVKAFILK
jgi:L-lactate dehydrogenase complex protein LldG